MKTIAFFSALLLAAVVGGCATKPQILGEIGPRHYNPNAAGGEGFLVVKSATRLRHVGEQTEYFTHTAYRVYRKSGEFFELVPNHVGVMDELPQLVKLPAGSYMIHALSDFGPVEVPVLIQAGETTEVNLVSATARRSRTPNDGSVVWMPTGKSRAYYEVGPRIASE